MNAAGSTPREGEPDDATLVEQFVEGDTRAFDLIYHRYARQVANIVFRLIGDDQEVDDLVQETFVVASRKLHTLRERSRLRSWLFTIAVRKVRGTFAKRSRKRLLMRSLKINAATSSDPGTLDRLEALNAAVATLSAKTRVPWIVHRVQGETIEDTARICEISPASVKRRVREADELINRRLARGT